MYVRFPLPVVRHPSDLGETHALEPAFMFMVQMSSKYEYYDLLMMHGWI